MTLPISNFKEWQVVQTGTGSVVISADGRKAMFDAGVGSGAQITRNITLSPGSRCVVKFTARAIRGDGNVWVHDKDTQTNRQQVLSDSWESYEIAACAKVYSNQENSYFRINIGVATANDGAIEVADFHCHIEDGFFGSLNTIALGSILLNAGTPSVFSNIVGVSSAVIAVDGFNLEVSVPKISSSTKTPIVICNRIEGTGVETAGQWIPRFYDKAAGVIRFRFFENGSTSPKSISTVNGAFSFHAICL